MVSQKIAITPLKTTKIQNFLFSNTLLNPQLSFDTYSSYVKTKKVHPRHRQPIKKTQISKFAKIRKFLYYPVAPPQVIFHQHHYTPEPQGGWWS